MQKVLTFPHAAVQQPAAASEAPDTASALLERSGHTFIGSILFLDIVEYAKKPVSEQLQVKDRFNSCLSQAIAAVAPSDRIILDTGDGAAVTFLGDPEDALFVAMNLAGLFERGGEPAFQVRSGINLGPVRLMRDINGQPNIIGDGINVAQRVMSFARPGQVLVSRSYHEVVTRLSQEYAQLFTYQGSRTDKHVREHEIYVVSAPVAQVHELATRRQHARPSRAKQAAAPRTSSWMRSTRLAWGFLALAAAALAGAAFLSLEGDDPATPAPAARVAAGPPRQVAPVPVHKPDPAPVASEPAAETALKAEPAPPARPGRAGAAPARSDSPRSGPAQPAGRPAESGPQVAALGPPVERAPETALLKPEPKPDPAPETKPEQPLSKPATLPTQYRASSGPTALVMLAISPWGEVLVDGKMAGVSPPMAELELAPGKHRIEVRNGAFKPYQTEVDLGPNETIRIKHKFLQGR